MINKKGRWSFWSNPSSKIRINHANGAPTNTININRASIDMNLKIKEILDDMEAKV